MSSYFYQLTSTILNDKNLNAVEKLTMAILNGLADESGNCQPSNEWLQEKLDLKERQMRIVLENLEKHGYIERTIYSCEGNPFKRYRIISVLAQFKKCLPGAEKCRSGGAEKCPTEGQKNAPIINKKELINKKKRERERAAEPPQREGAAPPTPTLDSSAQKPKEKEEIFSFNRVKMAKKALDTLIEEFGKEKIQEMLIRLDEYADINPKRFRQYANHATVIRKWMRDEAQKNPGKFSSSKKVFAEKLRIIIGRGGHPDIEVGPDYINFRRFRDAHFCWGENGFEEKVICNLRKMGYIIKE